jgi:MSHA biogenesis protein MshJ
MILAVRDQARQLAARMDALSVRERGLIFVAVLAVLFVAAQSLLYAPLEREQATLEKSVQQKRTQVQALETQLQGMLDSLTGDPDAESRAKLEALRLRVQQAEEQLARKVAGFVSPREMASLVEQALRKNRGLEVVRVENLPPAPLLETAKDEAASEKMVYRHGLRIEMRGRYLDSVSYLRALESLPWKVFWGEVTLESEKYPVSRVSVTIYTLSRHRGWIGT